MLDSFPQGVLDLVALCRSVPQQAALYDHLDKVAAFEELLVSRDLPLPSPRSKLSDTRMQACVDDGMLAAGLFGRHRQGNRGTLAFRKRALSKQTQEVSEEGLVLVSFGSPSGWCTA